MPGLPIAASARPRPLMDHAASGPVWPVWEAGLAQRLARLAVVMGAQLSPSGARPVGAAVLPRLRAHEGVGALSPSARPAARLYAHLTGRTFLAGHREAQAVAPAVLVGAFGAWDADLVRWASRPASQSPGLILASDGAELMRQVVLRSAALQMAEAPLARRIALFAHLPLDVLEDGRDVILGGQASIGMVRHWLSEAARGPAIVGFLGHSDGIDGKLSDEAVLCPLVEAAARYGGRSALQCLRDGTCYRTGLDRGSAEAAERLVPPSALGGAVLVADSCTVIPANADRIAPADSLGARIVEEADTGAVLLNAEVSLGNIERAAALLVEIAAGRPLGEAVARFNHGGEGRISRRLVLLGDPSLQFPPQGGGPETSAAGPAAMESRMVPRPAGPMPVLSEDCAFARRMAREMADNLLPRGRGRFGRWIASLDALDHLGAGASRQQTTRARLLGVAAAAQAGAFGLDPTTFPTEYWLRFATLADAGGERRCFCCDDVMTVVRADFAEGHETRLYGSCLTCMACLDMPVRGRIALSLGDGGHPRVSASLPGHPGRGRLFYHAPFSEGRQLWPVVPGEGARHPARRPPPRPDHPWMVGAFVGFGRQHAFALASADPGVWRAGEAARHRRVAAPRDDAGPEGVGSPMPLDETASCPDAVGS